MTDMFKQDPDYKSLYEKTLKDLEQLNNVNAKILKELENFKKQNEDYEKLRADKTFGVAVCGDVLLNKLEVEIVNTKDFQRLRKVRQLGSTYLVYPSAVHTRFEHSLGVLKQADEIIRNIKNNLHSNEEEKTITPEEEQIIRLLALLHDIGHMPYGHTIEDEFGIFRSHDKHETRWDYFLGKHSPIGQIIINHRSEEFHSLFFKLIKCEKKFRKYGLESHAFMYDIVSNTVCADLLDYLNRDCFYTNLKLSYHPRFLNYFFIGKRDVVVDKDKPELNYQERRVAIRAYKKNNKKELRRDIISELIQLLRNRYYLGERVYYHHSKIMTGTLLAGSVLRAKAANLFETLKIENKDLQNSIKNNEDKLQDKNLYNIHAMGDEELVIYLCNLSTKSKSPEQIKKINGAINLAKAYDQRIKYKQIIYKTKLGREGLGIEDEFDTYPLNEGKSAKNYVANTLHNRFIMYGTADERLNVEDNICEYLGMNSGDVLVYCPSFNMAMKLAKAIIENEKQELKELREFEENSIINECNSIIEKHQELWALRVFVNPRYLDEDEENLNALRVEFIKKYFNWILFSHSMEEEYDNGVRFWEDYFDYYFDKLEAEEKIKIDLNGQEKRKKKKELADELIKMTHGDRTAGKINKLIREKFKMGVDAK
jgi:uncharacterized protein